MPTRILGKTGVKVTVINLGCGGQVSQRLLDQAYDQGIRCLDTAGNYSRGKSEQEIGAWFARTGKRKEMFLVTKAMPRDEQKKGDLNRLLVDIDASLEALKTDYIDLYFIQGVCAKDYGEEAAEWPRSPQFKEVVAKLKKSGKARFVGFSSHDAAAPEQLQAAAEAGFADAIMISYNPVIGQADSQLSKALDACHKAGIGLIAMKTRRGIGEQLKTKVPEGQSLSKAIIHTVLSDPRIATVCSAMNSQAQIDENAAAARSFTRPLAAAELERMHRLLLSATWSFCPGCEACRGGIAANYPHVPDITRYLSLLRAGWAAGAGPAFVPRLADRGNGCPAGRAGGRPRGLHVPCGLRGAAAAGGDEVWCRRWMSPKERYACRAGTIRSVGVMS